MARSRNSNVPTLFEVTCMAAIKQAGGEFVDMPTIRLRLSRHGIEITEGAIYLIMKRLEARKLVWRTEHTRSTTPKGEAFVFFTLDDVGLEWLALWSKQLKDLL